MKDLLIDLTENLWDLFKIIFAMVAVLVFMAFLAYLLVTFPFVMIAFFLLLALLK